MKWDYLQAKEPIESQGLGETHPKYGVDFSFVLK
jgi:hypothetical protein